MKEFLYLVVIVAALAAAYYLHRKLSKKQEPDFKGSQPVYKMEPPVLQPVVVPPAVQPAPTYVPPRPDLNVVPDAPHVPQPIYYDFEKLFAPYKLRLEQGEDRAVVLAQYRAMLDALPKPPGSEGGGGEVPPVNLTRN